ncbi:MAG: LptF/LptG family permease [Ahrensia sp.]|nr:LptF/LptG family permease [Ahrensia sp.]
MLNRTLQVYIFFRMLKMTFYFILAISILIMLIDVSELSNRLSRSQDYSLALAFQISAMRLPFILQVAFPLFILSATMATLMQLNKKNELVIARSVGVSAWQFLAPIWVFAFLAGCFIILVVNPAATYGFSVASEIENRMRGRSTDYWTAF